MACTTWAVYSDPFLAFESYRNSLFEVCRAVSLPEARVEKLVKAWEDEV